MVRIVIERLWEEGMELPKYKDNVQTIGVIQVLNENQGVMLQGYSLELGDKNNQQQISRIPAGDYKVVRRWSPKFKDHFHILDVVNRSWILIHLGNFHRDILGCVLVGYNYKDLDGDGLNDVTDSRAFLNKMLSILPQEEFILRIVDENPLFISKST